jgi:uncharacterized membrane protein YqaE (UPF0057 family)
MTINRLTQTKTLLLLLVSALLFSCSSNKYSYQEKFRTDFDFGGDETEDVRYSDVQTDEETKKSETVTTVVPEESLDGEELLQTEKLDGDNALEIESVVEPSSADPVVTEAAPTKKLKREKKKKLKQLLKDYKKEKNNNHHGDDIDLILVILAFILPPLAVYLYEDGITDNFWIDLILTLLVWIPGVIYALIVIL